MSKIAKPWVVALIAAIFFFPFLGNVHLFDWDEINFAESAREMLLTGNWLRVQIDFQPFWEKPPLFFWFQALSMKIFGINEFAARFPNVIMGIVTLLTFFHLGKQLVDNRFGMLWVLVYLGSFTPHLYFKSGIIDPTFNYFMFVSIWFLFQSPVAEKLSYGFWAGLFAGLAVWTKGPVGVAIPTIVLGVVWIINRFTFTNWKGILVYTTVSAFFTLAWVGAIVFESGWQTFLAFLQYLYNLLATSEADHGQPFYYHFVVVLLGCFPMSIIGLRYLLRWKKGQNNEKIAAMAFGQWMLIVFWVVMIVFSIVKTKIVHYSSMAYFPLSFFAAWHLHQWLDNKIVWPRWATIMLIIVGTMMAWVLMAVPLIGIYSAQITPYIDDTFAVANLQANVHWGGWEWLIGFVLWLIILCLSVVWKEKKQRNVFALLAAVAICMFIYSAVVVPKIEGYSQRAAIAFYESKAGQDVYVWPVGFKSYAQYFYFKKPANQRLEASNEDWLINGPVDKPTYLIARIDRAEPYLKHPNLEVIEQKNGFVFLKRKATK
jgi:4-amino-4-deoxy-L-arabinose transferase-like glycosyltransferase